MLESDHRTLKLIDFGEARTLQPSGSHHAGDRPDLADPEFLAPECLEGGRGEVGTHSDMWSLGVLVFVLLRLGLIFLNNFYYFCNFTSTVRKVGGKIVLER